MKVSASQLAAVLKTLSVAQSKTKPSPPSPLGLVGGLVGSVGGLVNGLLEPLDGILHLGNILEVDPSKLQGNFQNLAASENDCSVEPYDSPPVLSQSFPPFDQAKANVFRYRQQQSVNLGSWFVHEQWMTPSIFSCASGPQVAEIDIASGWGNTTAARYTLERHWDTFINQSDFQYLASIGINTVRLPIGYWSLGPLYCQGTPFEPYADVYANSWSRVIRAINWAAESGIGVLVDLHGAPGSQNGQPHSGVSDGGVNLFGNATNIQKTKDVLLYLIQQFASVTNVIGIELLNEPNDDPSLQGFYDDTIAMMRQSSPEAANFPLYIHDAFNMPEYSGYAANRTDFVVEDHHSYFVFDGQDASRDAPDDTQFVKGSVMQSLTSTSNAQRRNLVVAEWSCALVDSSLQNSTNPMLDRQMFCQGQEQVYANASAGWHFWSYNKEGCDGDLNWCFKSAVNNTLPSTFFSYGQGPFTTPMQIVNASRAVLDMQRGPMEEVLQNFFGVSTSATASHTTSSSASSCSEDASGTQSNTLSNPMTSASTSSMSTASTVPSQKKRAFNARDHRFRAIQDHRSPSSFSKRALPSALAGFANYTGPQLSMTKGYSDGFLTAKIFAQYGLSRLGFTGQYIQDSIAALGSDIVKPGSESYYSEFFYHGLQDGEAVVSGSLPSSASQ